ncbi:MAG: hypothetical protein [Bacteriophage sp.]|nr:MAG: hypothetical protein [Bacteriophage sp.]
MNQTQPLFPEELAKESDAYRNAIDQVADVLYAVKEQLSMQYVAVAGGCARDLAHKVAPRDIDIVIVPQDEEDVFVLLRALDIAHGYKIVKDFDHADGSGFLFETLAAYAYETMQHDNRWSRVVKLEAPGKLGIDVLVSTCESLDDAVSLFDYNINQFTIRQPYTAPRFCGECQGVLVQNREASVSDERVTHIQNIARTLGWSVE